MENVSRSSAISTSSIVLTEDLPILRLKELCAAGTYKHREIWDRFANGYMITCELFYFVERKRRTLTKEVRWVETQDLHVAQNTIAAVILYKLGLGVSEGEEEEEEEEEVSAAGSMAGLGSHLAGMMEHLLTQPEGEQQKFFDESASVSSDFMAHASADTMSGIMNLMTKIGTNPSL